MTLVGLKKNEVTCLGEMLSDDDPAPVLEMMEKDCHNYIPNPNNPHCCEGMVEVVQEGVCYLQANEKETQEAVQELMNELNGMVDQATQTYPPPPEDDNEGIKRMVRMATIFQSPAFQNRRPRARVVDYMVCPARRFVWRSASPKRVRNMSYVPCILVCCFVLKRYPSTI